MPQTTHKKNVGLFRSAPDAPPAGKGRRSLFHLPLPRTHKKSRPNGRLLSQDDLAKSTRLELATSAVTGRCSNQLRYDSRFLWVWTAASGCVNVFKVSPKRHFASRHTRIFRQGRQPRPERPLPHGDDAPRTPTDGTPLSRLAQPFARHRHTGANFGAAKVPYGLEKGL